MSTKLTPRTKAALAVLHLCEGHELKADALAEAFAIVDHAVEYDAGHLPTEAQRQSLYGFKTILTELGAADYLSALRVIKRLKDQAAGSLAATQAKSTAEFNDKTKGWELANTKRRNEELEDFVKRFFDWGDTLVFVDDGDALQPFINEAETLSYGLGDESQNTVDENEDDLL